jgi:hypothetical protein
MSVALPRRSKDGDAVAVRPQHDAFIAEQRDAGMMDHEPGQGGLAGARLAREDVGASIRVEQPAAVDFHAFSLASSGRSGTS